MSDMVSAGGRGAERRRANMGGPGGAERRAPADRRAENNRLFVHFRIGPVGFLAPIHDVQEVMAAPVTTRVPLAPGLVTGVLNLRGQIVPAVDLRPVLERWREAPPEAPMVVVVRAADGGFALLADEVFDVLEASPTMVCPPPANLGEPLRGLATGVCKLPTDLLVVMDLRGVAALVAAHPERRTSAS